MSNEIRKVIEQTRATAEATKQNRRYYTGKHDPAFLTKKSTNPHRERINGLFDNQCRNVIDRQVNKLKVMGFAAVEEGDSASDGFAQTAYDLWQRDNMDFHLDAWLESTLIAGKPSGITCGFDSRGASRLWLQEPEFIAFERNEEYPDELLWAGKRWKSPRGPAITLYYPDHTEEWYSNSKVSDPDEASYKLDEESILPNPLGVTAAWAVPVTTSDLDTAVPLQRALNMTLANIQTADDYFSNHMRIFLGLEVEVDEETGEKIPPFEIDRENPVVVLPGNLKDTQAVSVMDLPGQSTEHLVAEAESYRTAIARSTNTPDESGTAVSGEERRVKLEGFTAKVEKRQGQFGFTLAAAVRAQTALHLGIPLASAPALRVVWAPAAPQSDELAAKVGKAQFDIGVPLEVILVRTYGWDQETADEIVKRNREQAALDAAEAAANSAMIFDAGGAA